MFFTRFLYNLREIIKKTSFYDANFIVSVIANRPFALIPMDTFLDANDKSFDFYDFTTLTKDVGKVKLAHQAAYCADRVL